MAKLLPLPKQYALNWGSPQRKPLGKVEPDPNTALGSRLAFGVIFNDVTFPASSRQPVNGERAAFADDITGRQAVWNRRNSEGAGKEIGMRTPQSPRNDPGSPHYRQRFDTVDGVGTFTLGLHYGDQLRVGRDIIAEINDAGGGYIIAARAKRNGAYGQHTSWTRLFSVRNGATGDDFCLGMANDELFFSRHRNDTFKPGGAVTTGENWYTVIAAFDPAAVNRFMAVVDDVTGQIWTSGSRSTEANNPLEHSGATSEMNVGNMYDNTRRFNGDIDWVYVFKGTTGMVQSVADAERFAQNLAREPYAFLKPAAPAPVLRISDVPGPIRGSGTFIGSAAFQAEGRLPATASGTFAGASAFSAAGTRVSRATGDFQGAAAFQAEGRVPAPAPSIEVVNRVFTLSANAQGRGDMVAASGDQDLRGIAYVVDSAAAPGGDGLTPETAWDSLADVVVPAGATILLMDDSVFNEPYNFTQGGGPSNFTEYCGGYIETGTNKLLRYNEGSAVGRGAMPVVQSQTATRTSTPNTNYVSLRYLRVEWPGYVGPDNNYVMDVTGQFINLDGVESLGYGSKLAAFNAAQANDDRGGVRLSGQNLSMKNCNIRYHSFQAVKVGDAGREIVIKGNVLGYCFSDAIRIDTNNAASKRVLIQNNALEVGCASDGIQSNSSTFSGTVRDVVGLWIFENLVFNSHDDNLQNENGLDLKGASDDIYVVGNIVHGNTGRNNGSSDPANRNSPGALHFGASHVNNPDLPGHVLFRHNLIYDNCGGITSARDTRSFQNTLWNNSRDFDGPNSAFTPGGAPIFTGVVYDSAATTVDDHGAVVKGNIIGAHNNDQEFLQPWWFNQGGAGSVINRNMYDTLDGWTPKDAAPIVGDPGFVNFPRTANGNYNQYDATTNGDGVDALPNACLAVGAGTGTVITVTEDQTFFQPGLTFTAENLVADSLPGDYVKVGANPVAQVVAVDHANDTITVDQALTWADGEVIFQCDAAGNVYNDMGACQNGVLLAQAPPQP